MKQNASFPRRLFLQSAGLVSSSAVLAACAEPAFVLEPVAPAPPPVKMQRLLLWLPPDDKTVDWALFASQLGSALSPFGVTTETGRSIRLSLSRSDDQKASIARFNPNYRLEIDIADATSVGSGTVTAASIIVMGALFRGDSRTPLARFHHHARSRTVPQLAPEIVEMFRKGGYL
jgi:hypothetical protein